jgi:hypothetical protein
MHIKEEEHRSSSSDEKRSNFTLITSWELRKKVVKNFESIKSVVELQEHRIKFRKAKKCKSFLDIKLENGYLKSHVW